MVLDLIQVFFYSYGDDQVIVVFASINVLYYIYWFAYIEPSLHPWDEADLVMVSNLSDMLLNSVSHYCIEDFKSSFIKFSFLDVPLSSFGMSVMLAS
jgi:hypothetical protein